MKILTFWERELELQGSVSQPFLSRGIHPRLYQFGDSSDTISQQPYVPQNLCWEPLIWFHRHNWNLVLVFNETRQQQMLYKVNTFSTKKWDMSMLTLHKRPLLKFFAAWKKSCRKILTHIWEMCPECSVVTVHSTFIHKKYSHTSSAI